VYLPSPLVYGEHLYTAGNNGILSVYDAKTGTAFISSASARAAPSWPRP
jgi:hypothetical protein